mgnify:CR=1 FL=1
MGANKKANNYSYAINFSHIKKIILLASPIIISNLSRVFMELADMVMIAGVDDIGENSNHALAAIGFSAMLLWIVFSIGISLRTSTQTITSRRFGEKKYNGCGQTLQHGHLIALMIGGPITLLLYYCLPDILAYSLSEKNNQLLAYSNDYSSFVLLSICFMYASFVFQGFYNGIKMTKIHMTVMVIANLLNVYLNAGLIYGSDNIKILLNEYHLGWLSFLWNIIEFPEMHIKGAGLATMIASIAMFCMYFLFLFKSDLKNKYQYFRLQIDELIFNKHVILTAPLSFQELFSS